MNTLIKNIGFAFVVFTVTLISCNNTASLQKYFVDSQQNEEFIAIDLPASILKLKDVEVSEDVKNTLNTIKKINFLALQVNETNKDFYTSEKDKVKKILKNPNYKQLMRFTHNLGNVSVSFLGEDEAIDEVIIFGSDDQKGFAIIRVTGENMNPTDILKISQEIKLDGDSNEFKQLEGLLGSLK